MAGKMQGDERFGLERKIRLLGPVKLDSGAEFAPIDFAYETYGTLNTDKSNAILICHALTGDQYVASTHPLTGKEGWWTRMVGPGKPIDPVRHCIISINVMGSCMGSSGPASIDPSTGGHTVWRFRSLPSPTWCGRRRYCLIIWGYKRLRLLSADQWVGCRH